MTKLWKYFRVRNRGLRRSDIGCWRPKTLRTAYPIFFACTCAILAIILQVIQHECTVNRCNSFDIHSEMESEVDTSANSDRLYLVTLDMFMYGVLPPTLAVILALLWATPHHHIVRLEPYFQMSDAEGATPQNSLLLDYEYMLPHTLLATSFKRRHWVVFLSTCILQLITFGAAPLMSGIFDERTLESMQDRRGISMSLDAEWLPRVTPNFTYSLFDYFTEGVPLADFTTTEYAMQHVLSIYPKWQRRFLEVDFASYFRSRQLWQQIHPESTTNASTVLYGAQLSCDPAQVVDYWWTDESGFGARFSSRVWNITVELCDANRMSQDWNSPNSWKGNNRDGTVYNCTYVLDVVSGEWSSSSFVFPVDSLHGLGGKSVYVWAGPMESKGFTSNRTERWLPRNISAVLCTPSYYTQEVSVTLRGTGRVTNSSVYQRNKDPTPFTNTNGFEYLLDGGYTNLPLNKEGYIDSQGKSVGFGQRPVLMMDPEERVRRKVCPMLIHDDASPKEKKCVAFFKYTLPAYMLLNITSSDLPLLLDPDFASKAYARTFRTIFAFAVSGALATSSRNPGLITEVSIKNYQYPSRAFVVNKAWIAISQVVLWVLCIMVLVLAWINRVRVRPCHLDGEPNSLSEMLHLLQKSPGVCDVLREGEAEYAYLKSLNQHVKQRGGRYKLLWVPNRGSRIEMVLPVTEPQPEGPAEFLLNGADRYQATENGSIRDGHLNSGTHLNSPDPSPSKKPIHQSLQWPLRRRYTIPITILLAIVGGAVYLGDRAAYQETGLDGVDTYMSSLNPGTYIYNNPRGSQGLPAFRGPTSLEFKLLYSYLPFFAGTLAESVIVIIAIAHSMLAPYDHLRRKHSDGQDALGVDFDTTLPQFQMLKAFRLRSFTICGLSTAILAAQMLAITFSTLFISAHTQVPVDGQFQMAQVPKYEQPSTCREVFRAMEQSVTTERLPPTWTTKDYYVLPFFPTDSTKEEYLHNLVMYQGQTLGVGLDVNCHQVSVNLDNGSFNGTLEDRRRLSARDAVKMDIGLIIDGKKYGSAQEWWVNVEKPASDLVVVNRNPDDTVDILVVWMELPGNPAQPRRVQPLAGGRKTLSTAFTSGQPYKLELDFMGLRCTGAVQYHELTAVVNATQHILSIPRVNNVTVSKKAMMDQQLFANSAPEALQEALLQGLKGNEGACQGLCETNALMSRINPAVRRYLSSNVTYIPEASQVAWTLEHILRGFWAISIRYYAEGNFTVTPQVVGGTIIMRKERVFMEVTSYFIVVSVIGYIVLVLVLVLLKRHIRGGPLPTTLATSYTLLYASTAQKDTEDGTGKTPQKRLKNFRGMYKLGEFKNNNVVHWGVYRDPEEEEESTG